MRRRRVKVPFFFVGFVDLSGKGGIETMNGTIAKYFKSPKGDDGQRKSSSGEEELKDEGKHVAAVEEEPEPGPSKPSKSEVDRLIAENMASVLKSLKKKRSHRCSKRKRAEEHREKGETPAEDDGKGVGSILPPTKLRLIQNHPSF